MSNQELSFVHPKVQAALDLEKVDYKVHRHADYPQPITSPADFANALGYPLERITKTVFLRSQDSLVKLLVVCSINRKLDLVTLATSLNCKRLELAGRTELAATLDYPPTGVSPLGVADLPVFMDAALFNFPTVLIGGGVAGVEVELAPSLLQQMAKAEVKNLTLE